MPRQQRSRRTQARRTKMNKPLRAALSGAKSTPPADPPTVTRQPWNTLTAIFTWSTIAGTPATIRPSDIAAVIRGQVGLNVNTGIEMRLHRIRTWNITGNAIAQRTFDLRPPNNTINDPLSVLIDRPARNRWARVGYAYASAQRMNVLQSSDTTTTCFQTEGQVAADSVLSHVDLLWRPSTSIDVTSTSAFEEFPAFQQQNLVSLQEIREEN